MIKYYPHVPILMIGLSTLYATRNNIRLIQKPTFKHRFDFHFLYSQDFFCISFRVYTWKAVTQNRADIFRKKKCPPPLLLYLKVYATSRNWLTRPELHSSCRANPSICNLRHLTWFATHSFVTVYYEGGIWKLCCAFFGGTSNFEVEVEVERKCFFLGGAKSVLRN